MKTSRIRIKDIVKQENITGASSNDDIAEFVEDTGSSATNNDILVDFINVKPVEIPTINDTFGRISDAVDAAMHSTGLAVIPLDMLHIAPELENLQRHEIYEFNGNRYAMALKPREKAVNDYQEKIIKNLSTGVPFKENLGITIEYNGEDFFTLALSRCEWTVVMSMFRMYRQRLYDNGSGDIVLEIYAERA